MRQRLRQSLDTGCAVFALVKSRNQKLPGLEKVEVRVKTLLSWSRSGLLAQTWRVIGKAPLQGTWVEVNTGDFEKWCSRECREGSRKHHSCPQKDCLLSTTRKSSCGTSCCHASLLARLLATRNFAVTSHRKPTHARWRIDPEKDCLLDSRSLCCLPSYVVASRSSYFRRPFTLVVLLPRVLQYIFFPA